MTRFMRQLARLIAFRLIPVLLALGILWNGWSIAQAISRRINEQQGYEQARPLFVGTATAIAGTVNPPTATATATPTLTLTATETATATLTPTVTDTATATATSTATASATSSPTDQPTATAIPTETAFPTVFQASATADSLQMVAAPGTEVPLQIAQAESFATNTPASAEGPDQSLVFATNTPQGGAVEVTATLISSATSLSPSDTPTVAPSATPVPSLSPVPLPTATAAPVEAAPRALPTVLFLGDPDPAQVDVTAIPPRVDPLPREGYDLFNILLLGTDAELTNDGFRRTDTMIVLSINRTTGTVAMLSLPRDMFVYIPAWGMQRLNLAWARGENGGWVDGPFELIRQTILYNFGINVHYYALVDLTGFKEAIDVVGGVTVDVDCALQDLPLIGAEVPAAARQINEEGYYVLDVGEYQLNGAEALWYARSRNNADDFDRGRRQQQILRAVWRKALDTNQLGSSLANVPELWAVSSEIVETNLQFEDVLGLAPLALSLQPGMIENFALIRTYHTTPWQTPAGDYVQLPVHDTLRPLLEDFYRPPTESQILLEGARIRVLNGTSNPNWDRVAASRLAWDGLNAFAAGQADTTDHVETTLIDYTGQSKGSSRGEIARILNVRAENEIITPLTDREYDFDVILGSNYNSCTFDVLPVEG